MIHIEDGAVGGQPLQPVLAGDAPTVTDVRCRVFRARPGDDIAMSFGAMGLRVMILVEVELDDGTVGRGETWANYPSWAWQERVASVQQGVRPLLVGTVVTHPVAVHSDLMRRLGPLGRQWGAPGPIRQAVSGADSALWDALARRRGLPLVDLLGGARHTSLLAYGSSIGPTEVIATAERCAVLGLRAVKVKVGFGRDADLTAIRQTRDVLGDQVQVFADANQAWTPQDASEMAAALRDEGVCWLEEPIAGDRAADLRALTAATGMPVATGENLYGLRAFVEHAAGGVAILQPDVTKCGGVTEYLAVAAAVRLHGTTVNPHLYNGAVAAATTLHVAAAVPATTLLEWDVRSNPLRVDADHLLRPDGTVTVPAGPGIGLEPDLDRLARYEEKP